MNKSMPHLQGAKKATLYCFSVGALLLTLVFSGLASAKTYNVAIISSGNSAIYTRIIDSIKNTITNQIPASFAIFNYDKITPLDNTKINNSDLLLTIGQRGMLTAAQRKKSPPIVATLVPRQSFQQSYSALKSVNKKVTAIYIDSPPERQIYLAKILLGKMQTVGILLSEKTAANKNHIIVTLNNIGLSYRIEEVSSANNIIGKLSRAINNSDALLAVPDPIIFNRNTARNILLTTYRKRIPVIGFSANYVKAGALAAAFSTPEQIAEQTGKTIVKILTHTTEFPYGGKYPEDFDVAINQNVARSLGINIPPKIAIKKSLQKLLVKYK